MVSSDKQLTIPERERMHHHIVECSFETTVIHSNHTILYINEAGAEFFGGNKEQLIGANVVEVFTEEYRDFIVQRIQRGQEDKQVGKLVETAVYRMDGKVVEVELFCHPVIYGETEAMQSTIRDITTKKQMERELNKVMMPIVPVKEGIVILPLVGEIDASRSKYLKENFCANFSNDKVKHLIIDVSGIYAMTKEVIELMNKFVKMLVLMGITTICTGIRPEIAWNIVNTNSKQYMLSIPTMATVKEAIDYLE
ncbi:PAS domain S-box protein [Gracilibacillus caseinilyticus]|uniref:PAS domain S-box protein n=1 Tax=Gracilibacillus caseinilyticus TaxID=2932256 RepID=A0ABY4ER87_9BACI|nr:PAS domain S-box protein [Gracilibacillus caseinilyticus]UOQ46606.1 PAS domain S-box protein [Gracilibacillus caseinilyticus]